MSLPDDDDQQHVIYYYAGSLTYCTFDSLSPLLCILLPCLQIGDFYIWKKKRIRTPLVVIIPQKVHLLLLRVSSFQFFYNKCTAYAQQHYLQDRRVLLIRNPVIFLLKIFSSWRTDDVIDNPPKKAIVCQQIKKNLFSSFIPNVWMFSFSFLSSHHVVHSLVNET